MPMFGLIFAYGPAPGVELIPYFLGLMTWAALAVSAILWWPVAALVRRLRKGPSARPTLGAPTVPSVPESPGDASRDPA
jgi:hypothetical protein